MNTYLKPNPHHSEIILYCYYWVIMVLRSIVCRIMPKTNIFEVFIKLCDMPIQTLVTFSDHLDNNFVVLLVIRIWMCFVLFLLCMYHEWTTWFAFKIYTNTCNETATDTSLLLLVDMASIMLMLWLEQLPFL